MLSRCRVDVGPILGRCLVDVGSTLGRIWVDVGSMLGRGWVEFGSFLMFFVQILCGLNFAMRLDLLIVFVVFISLYFALMIVLYWCFRDLQWGMCSPTQARGVRPKASTRAMPLSWPIHTGKCSYGVGLSRFPMSAICLPTMVLEVCSKGLEPSSYTRERYFTISISRDCALRGVT